MSTKKANIQEKTAAKTVAPIVKNFPIVYRDGEAIPEDGQVFTVDLTAPNKAIGEHCAKNSKAVSFMAFGAKITIPAAGNKGGAERFYATVKEMAAAIYGTGESTEIPETDEAKQFLSSLRSLGVYFSDFRKGSVMEAIDIRLKRTREVAAVPRNLTRSIEENRALVAETGTARKLNQLLKKEGLPAALAEVEKMKKEGNTFSAKLLTAAANIVNVALPQS